MFNSYYSILATSKFFFSPCTANFRGRRESFDVRLIVSHEKKKLFDTFTFERLNFYNFLSAERCRKKKKKKGNSKKEKEVIYERNEFKTVKAEASRC